MPTCGLRNPRYSGLRPCSATTHCTRPSSSSSCRKPAATEYLRSMYSAEQTTLLMTVSRCSRGIQTRQGAPASPSPSREQESNPPEHGHLIPCRLFKGHPQWPAATINVRWRPSCLVRDTDCRRHDDARQWARSEQGSVLGQTLDLLRLLFGGGPAPPLPGQPTLGTSTRNFQF